METAGRTRRSSSSSSTYERIRILDAGESRPRESGSRDLPGSHRERGWFGNFRREFVLQRGGGLDRVEDHEVGQARVQTFPESMDYQPSSCWGSMLLPRSRRKTREVVPWIRVQDGGHTRSSDSGAVQAFQLEDDRRSSFPVNRRET